MKLALMIVLGLGGIALLLRSAWLLDERANRTEHYARAAYEAVAEKGACR